MFTIGKLFRSKKFLSLFLIIIGLPFSIGGAASGGGLFAMVFAAMLAIGVDMFIDTIHEKKNLDFSNTSLRN